MNIIIRPATEQDIPLLKPLGMELQDTERSLDSVRTKGSAIVDKYNEILLREFLKGDYQVFVAEVDGKLVGYTAGYPNDPNDDFLNEERGYHFDDMVVLPEYRKTGIASKLLEAITNYAREQGFRSVELNVLSENKISQSFCRSHGFTDYELVLRKSL